MLSDFEGSDVESLHTLTINEHYAKAFEYRKEREELQKLKEKYGSDYGEDEAEDEDDSDSESDESEDEDGEELTPIVDAAILRTLARIRRKDPEIYDAEKNIFGEEQEKIVPIKKPARIAKDKSKVVTMRQVALEAALNPESRSPSPEPLTHVEEQRALRDETIAAFHQAVAEDDDDDGLLIPREKTKDEQEVEEEEYRSFLEREVGGDLRALVTGDLAEAEAHEDDHISDEEEDKKVKDQTKKKKKKAEDRSKDSVPQKSKAEADQEFLMNYILNRGWIDRSADHIPTYREITSSKPKGKGKAKQEADSDEDSDDAGEFDAEGRPTADPDLDEEDFEEIIDRFESSYNHRFEEPDAAEIKSYPRNMPSLVRREDTTRKEARERRKQRKAEELLKRKEEMKRLKGLKMKEIRSKLERIGKEGGKDLEKDKALQELDLEGDWDPDAHDRQMAGLYGEDEFNDDERPQWDDDIDIGDIPMEEEDDSIKKSKKKKKKKKKDDEDDDMAVDIDEMDANVERMEDDDEWDGTEEMRKRKLDEYMDEIYGLDFNGLVGDMPTRFKYVPIQSQNFALTPVEILMATDQELNEYMSVKKYAPYRKEVKWDSTRNDRLKELKNKLSERVPSGFVAGSSRDGGGEKPAKKRMGKKERMKMKAGTVEGGEGGDAEATSTVAAPTEEPVQKRKRNVETEETAVDEATQETLKKKRRRRKQKESKEDGLEV